MRRAPGVVRADMALHMEVTLTYICKCAALDLVKCKQQLS
jgi:hypothetical protein